MATSSIEATQQFSANISVKIQKWVQRATSLVRERKKNSRHITNQLNCEGFKSGGLCSLNEQRNKSSPLPSSSRPRQRKLACITPPNLEKIVERPQRSRKMSAPCYQHTFGLVVGDKSLKRNAYSGDNLALLKCEESCEGCEFDAKNLYLLRSNSDNEERDLISSDAIDIEINNNDNYGEVKEAQQCGKLNFIDNNEQETRKHSVNINDETSLFNKCSTNNTRAYSDEALHSVCKGKKSCSVDSEISFPHNIHMRSEELAMPELSQQITTRLQKWVESATIRALARDRKVSEDSISSNSSNNDSISSGILLDAPLRTRNEPAKPSEIKELELAIKELVTGVGNKAKSYLKRESEGQEFTRDRQESFGQTSDSCDNVGKLSDFRFDESSDCTSVKDDNATFSDDQTISKGGLTNSFSIEQSFYDKCQQDEKKFAFYHKAKETDEVSGFIENPKYRSISGKTYEFEDISYANIPRMREINIDEQQDNKFGVMVDDNTKEAMAGQICLSKNELKGNKTFTVAETINSNRDKELQSLETSLWERSTSNTSDEEKRCSEKQWKKSSKKTPPPRPPRPNMNKRYTSPNSEGLKIRDKAKRDSLPSDWDFKDAALEEFAQACVKQANQKSKLIAIQKKEPKLENDKPDDRGCDRILKQKRPSSHSLAGNLESSGSKENLKKITKESKLSSGFSKSMSSLCISQKSLDEQKGSVSNDEELYRKVENLNSNSFKQVEERDLNVFEKLSKSLKDNNPKTFKLHKFPSLPLFYRPRSPKNSTAVEKTVKPSKLIPGRKRSGTMPSNIGESSRKSLTSDPFYDNDEPQSSAEGPRRKTNSADSLFNHTSGQDQTDRNSLSTENKCSDKNGRRRNASVPSMVIPYVEELV